MLALKRIIFIAVFLVVWIGSVFLYATGTSGTPKESVFVVISIFWVVVFVFLARKVFRKSPVDANMATAAGVAQVLGGDSLDEVDFDT